MGTVEKKEKGPAGVCAARLCMPGGIDEYGFILEAWVKESPCGPPFEGKGGQPTSERKGDGQAC